MVYYTYKIFFCNEYDYARYMKGDETIYSKIHIPEEEWKQIVTKAFKEIFKQNQDPCLCEIMEYIVENDNRFISEKDLLIPIGNSEIWEPSWDNWSVDEYDPQTMIMCKKEDEKLDEAIFLIP